MGNEMTNDQKRRVALWGQYDKLLEALVVEFDPVQLKMHVDTKVNEYTTFMENKSYENM